MSFLASLRRVRTTVPTDGFYRWIDTPEFSYGKWLNDSGPVSIGKIPRYIVSELLFKPRRVAVIGGGASGLCAKRELARCDAEVDLFEADPNRYGGRMYSKNMGGSSIAELGAMRFPGSEQLLFRYLQIDPETLPAFPDPGVVETEISYQGGNIPWDGQGAPPGFQTVSNGWGALITQGARAKAGSGVPDLPALATIEADLDAQRTAAAVAGWQTYLTVFGGLSFFDGLNRLFGSSSLWEPPGGTVWTEEDFAKFATLGVGSGGFGPMYTTGFNSIVRLVVNGLETKQLFLIDGIEQLATKLIDGTPQVGQARNYLNTKIVSVTRDTGTKKFTLRDANGKSYGNYDRVICASNLWAAGIETNFLVYEGNGGGLPLLDKQVVSAAEVTHVTSSSKLFLKSRSFWLDPTLKLPRVILSDTAFHQLYTLNYEATPTPDSAGMVLISYAWEDESTRTLALSANDRYTMFKEQVRRINPTFAECLEPYSGSLDDSLAMIDWQATANQNGAFQLSQAGQDAYVHAMFYDYLKAANPATDSGFYLAGDGISWCGGWVDSALQTGLNATAAVVRSLNGTFNTPGYNPMLIKPDTYTYTTTTP